MQNEFYLVHLQWKAIAIIRIKELTGMNEKDLLNHLNCLEYKTSKVDVTLSA